MPNTSMWLKFFFLVFVLLFRFVKYYTIQCTFEMTFIDTLVNSYVLYLFEKSYYNPTNIPLFFFFFFLFCIKTNATAVSHTNLELLGLMVVVSGGDIFQMCWLFNKSAFLLWHAVACIELHVQCYNTTVLVCVCCCMNGLKTRYLLFI